MNNSNLPPLPASATEPTRIGHYELLECIGRGGMGLVYRARDTKLERDVAVKCLRTELFEDHYVERFTREALLLAKLNHPNIVQIYDFIAATEQVALVMELVDGQNLQTYLREHIVPVSQRLQWLVQISEGLAVAHDAGIIHRDLKTENILINKRGQAKITDLGIAKSQDFNATLTDHVAGSYCSMSPEQAMGEAITFKSDLFSLGILAYQLLCGAHPFGDTNNKLQTMQRIISHPPTAPHKHNPDLPAEFIDLLGQLLSKDPDKRPDNTHWVAAQFETLKALHWQEPALGDDTQALITPVTSANIRASRTQDHPTFDTRFVAMPATPKVSARQKIKRYIAANKITVSSAAISFLIIAGVVVWQLQSKPPKYVAVIPPKLTAEDMQESQQELVKGAVYDAIQQSVIQLNGYYLTIREDITEEDNVAHIIQTTDADEVIRSEINCNIESCKISLVKLNSQKASNGKVQIAAAKNVDVLIDNFLSIAATVQQSTNQLFKQETNIYFDDANEKEYAAFLTIYQEYLSGGANDAQLEAIDNFTFKSQILPQVQSIYKDICLDLYYASSDERYLERLESILEKTKNQKTKDHLLNEFYLNVAKREFSAALENIDTFFEANTNTALRGELFGYIYTAQNQYKKAIESYERSLKIKKNPVTLTSIANNFWYAGDTNTAKKYLADALQLAPNQYKAHSLAGLIALLEGDIQQSIISFNKVVALKPRDVSNINNLGISYLLMHEYENAYALFSRAIEISPKNINYHLNQADTLNLQGKSEQALAIYKTLTLTASQQETDDPATYRVLSQAYAHMGDYNKALSALQQAERLDPLNIETTYVASLVHTLAKNNSSALLGIETSLKNGLDISWFKFEWFTRLCEADQFISLLTQYGEPNHCPPKPHGS